jgi:hypothetical protein
MLAWGQHWEEINPSSQNGLIKKLGVNDVSFHVCYFQKHSKDCHDTLSIPK